MEDLPRRLEAFLRAEAPGGADLRVVGYEVMTGGYSRFMARFEVAAADGASERRRFVLRGDPPPDQAMFFTDRDLEVAVIDALCDHGAVRVPRVVHYDASGDKLGTKAMIIEFVHGASLLSHAAGVQTSAEQVALGAQLADTAAEIHRTPVDKLPGSLERPADWDSYMTALIGQWKAAEQGHVEAEPFMRYVASWLDAHRPAPVPLTLVHGDFQTANVILEPDGTYAVVDWEFAHVGDPREDLGWFKAVAAASPPDLISADELGFCARYRELTGLTEEQVNPAVLNYFLVLSAIKIYAPLIQQQGLWGTTGQGGSTLLAYNLSVPAFSHRMWLMVVDMLGAVMGTGVQA